MSTPSSKGEPYSGGDPTCPTGVGYAPIIEYAIGIFRKPIVYALTIASLLSPMQAYADACLEKGKEDLLVEYVKKQPELLSSFERVVRLYTQDAGKGVELIVAAIASPNITKGTEQHRNYTVFRLITPDKENRIPLPKNEGERLEECIRRINAAPKEAAGEGYCHPCGGMYLPPAQTPVESQPQSQPTSRPVGDYERLHAERKGRSGAGPIIAGGIVALGLLLGGAKHAAGVGGVINGGGGGAGRGFSHGGTSRIPPLPGAAHR